MRPSNVMQRGYTLLSTWAPQDIHTRERKVADILGLSKTARLRLEWMIWYRTNGRNALATSRHFGIAPKTFHKWRNLFREDNLRTLEDRPKTPKQRRRRQISSAQEMRIV